jgi:signal transduction histidine kinase
MRRVPGTAAILLAFGMTAAARADESDRAGAMERIARIFSREVREARPRLDALTEELEKLPALHRGSLGSRYGYHSGTISDQDDAQWVQFDLGRRCAIDTIVAMPAHIATIETAGDGYGFPLRFVVEVADDPAMTNAVLAVDRSMADVENPGRYPLVLPTGTVAGRYVRFTSTRHVPSNEGFFWALEELMVLSGNRNVAVGCEVLASSQLELFPNWALERINDGLSALGMPVTAESSPTNGYLSVSSEQATAEKWLMVDLGRECAIDEIRLLPAGSEKDVTPKGFPRMAGRAFPKSLVVEIADAPGFEDILWRREIAMEPLGYPWSSPVTMPCGGCSGRFIRVATRELWERGKDLHNFALAELQAYSGNENVALGKPVTTKDAADRPDSTRWKPEFAVDGFTSRHPLVEVPEHLELIGRRAALEREQTTLRAQRDRKVRQTATILSAGGGGLGAVALFGWAWMLVRRKAVRSRDVARLREQIARDLHDDIGSNLGGIVLLSEMGSRHRGIDDEARGDFAAIKKAAEETAESMQDIVWLIQPGSLGLRELVVKLRKSVEMIIGTLAVRVVVDPPDFRNRDLSLVFRRHFFFAFKETLNNVRKHAAATRVEVAIEITLSDLAFTVRDNGKGFDSEADSGCGHGLNNLRRRAERLKGIYRLESEPGRGTSVSFKAPLNSK